MMAKRLLRQGNKGAFWGEEDDPTVFLWEGLDADGREKCKQIMETRTG